jgi:hypothetical protein
MFIFELRIEKLKFLFFYEINIYNFEKKVVFNNIYAEISINL